MWWLSRSNYSHLQTYYILNYILFHLPCVAEKRAIYDKYGKEGLHGMLIWISGYYMQKMTFK
jgi:hypothetical protein